MAMHAGITGGTSGTVFNVAGTRVGVHVIPPGSSGSSDKDSVARMSSTVLHPPRPEPEVRQFNSVWEVLYQVGGAL